MRGYRSHVSDEELVRLHLGERLTLTAIARQVGLSKERVRQRMRRAGISPQKTHEIAKQSRAVGVIRCRRCSAEIVVTPSEAKRRKFCSRACASRSRVPTYSHDDLLDHLRAVADRIGRTPTAKVLNAVGPPHAHIFFDRFGSLTRAQELAGLEPNRRGGWWPRRNRK